MKNLLQSINALKRKWLVFAAALMVSSSGFGLTISTSQTWNAIFFSNPANVPAGFTWNGGTSTLTANQDILVDRGAGSTRVIFSIAGITVSFSNSAHGITVDVGEKLVVTNTTLTATTYWQGISATGDPLEDQWDVSGNVPEIYEVSDATTDFNPDQTMVEIESGSGTTYIYNALKGVTSTGGAIVIADHIQFWYCRVGIEIKDYTHPTTGSAGFDQRNASYISDCLFQSGFLHGTDNDFSTYKCVALEDVYGIHIQGNVFRFPNGSAYPVPNCTGMGYGIYAYNSSFAVHNSGTATRDNTTNCISYDGAPTGFEYFSFSIYSEESAIAPAIRSKTTIANANISHATNGITIKGGDAHLITKCSVKVDQQRRVDLLGYIGCGTPKGVFLKDVGSFVVDHTVFEAVFSSTGGFLNQNMDLLHVDNGGDKPNRITENTFQTSGTYAQPTAVIGMRFSNNNSNIQPWCNNAFSGTYTTCIWVESGPINLEWQPAGGYNIGNTYAGGLYLNNTAGSGNEISYYEDILFFPPAGKFSPATGPGAWDFVQTFNENPCDDLQCWFWYPYSVKEVDAVEFNLYPNPQNKNGRVTIDFPDEFTGSITIYNLLGSEIHSRNVKYTQREELNTLGLQPGIYMIVFQAKNGARKSGLLSITE